MIVAEQLSLALRARGVEVAFGLLSDDIMQLVAALESDGIRYVGARHESQAVLMAEGYAFATGGLGVAVIGRGAASMNALPASVFASRTGSQVLVIAGDAPFAGPNAHGPDIKRIDGQGQAGVYAAAGVRAFAIASPDTALTSLAAAVAHAESGNAAAVHLPTSVMLAPADAATEPVIPPTRPPAPTGATREAIATAAAVLADAKRPVILAGRGAHLAGARAPLEQLAERIGAVLCTTQKAAGLFASSPYEIGLIGSFSDSAGRKLIDQADCILVVGAGLNMYSMSHGRALPPVPIVHVDARRPAIGRWTPAQVAVVGDAAIVAEQLLDALPEREEKPFHEPDVLAALASFSHTDDYEEASSARNVDPRSLALELDRLLPEQRTIVYDAGNFLTVVPYLTVPDPDHVKMTSESGSIGLGIGTALGVAYARPTVTTVLVTGDGGLLMTLGELETAVREDIPLVVVVINDRAFGAERHLLEIQGLPVRTSVFPEVDFAAVAAELGFDVHTIASLDDLRAAAPALTLPTGPVLLDCLVNPDVCAPFISEMFDSAPAAKG